MKKWQIKGKSKVRSLNFKVDELVKILLKNRGITTKKEIGEFLNPILKKVTSSSVKIKSSELFYMI